MGIVIPDSVDKEALSRALEARGWRPIKIDGNPGYEKTVESWTWLVKFVPDIEFISFTDEENPYLHAQGVSKLKREVEEIAKEIGFSLVSSINLDFTP
ncbi:MAG: hypothetical protein KatS3mg078_1299 [Deltaproteobacteria bacterium]|nr:MAG: hypothetical protein KatS3mg078_1299 [Deltaproteobacteria bacterium]